jgi:hypothetical protein
VTGIVIFAVADLLGVLGVIWTAIDVSIFHGRCPASRAVAIIIASLLAYNFVSWRMGLGWTGQLAALAISAAILWAGRSQIRPLIPLPAQEAPEVGGDAEARS